MSPLSWQLALKWLRSTRRDAFASVLSAVTVVGIAVGCAALIVALAALEGMQAEIREQVLSRTPGLEIALPAGADPVEIARRVENLPGVRAVRTVVRGRGWVLGPAGGVPVEIYGHQGEVPESVPGAAGLAPGLYLPESLAARLGLEVGGRVTIVAARPLVTPIGPVPRKLALELSGTFGERVLLESERVVLPIARAEMLLGAEQSRRIEVSLIDLNQAFALARRLLELLPAGSEIRTWRDLQRGLFVALRLERIVMFQALSLVILVAVLVLFSDLSVIAAAKRQEIALLQSLGCSRRGIVQSFLLLGLLLAGFGAIAGTLSGAGLAWLADRQQWIRLDPGLLLFEALPFRVEWVELLRVPAVALLLAGGFAALAGWRSLAEEPALGLRS